MVMWQTGNTPSFKGHASKRKRQWRHEIKTMYACFRSLFAGTSIGCVFSFRIPLWNFGGRGWLEYNKKGWCVQMFDEFVGEDPSWGSVLMIFASNTACPARRESATGNSRRFQQVFCTPRANRSSWRQSPNRHVNVIYRILQLVSMLQCTTSFRALLKDWYVYQSGTSTRHCDFL